LTVLADHKSLLVVIAHILCARPESRILPPPHRAFGSWPPRPVAVPIAADV
jgi:hypothetical protein